MDQLTSSKRVKKVATTTMRTKEAALVAALGLAILPYAGHAEQPPPPCHPNLQANQDMAKVRTRGDVVNLPDPLKQRLVRLADRPHSQLPTQAYAEAHFDTTPFKPKPSQLFQYYLLDTTGFEPSPFTAVFPGVNDAAMLPATGPACGLPTIGAVRVVLEPKPGLPTDPNDVRAFIDIFTDISGLFVINNESGWYEGWMIHDLRVAPVFVPGKPRFGTITAADAAALAAMGNHNNVAGNIFTVDGNAVRFPSATDHFPDRQGNTPNTVGVIQASGPRDPDKFDAEIDAQREFRQRFIPSGLANEIFLDVYERVVSFEPGVPFPTRLYDAYAAEVARVGHNGVVSAAEGDVDTASDGFANNDRLFIPATQFNRFAVTREINDGLLAPRFAPSQRAWVMSGTLVPVSPSVPASEEEDGDDR